jgi:hypothetical protein
MINHEVISARGRVVTEKKAPANRGVDLVLSTYPKLISNSLFFP